MNDEEDHVGESTGSSPVETAGNFFKLADEAQMGDLSSLMSNNNHSNILHNSLKRQHHQGPGFTDDSHKRLLFCENSVSSNSSEDTDILARKTGRSCKGKIYKELMSSGQIAVLPKKTKIAKGERNELLLNKPQQCKSSYSLEIPSELQQQQQQQPFDLEEKIKELPALNLDVYLARKRVGKKKKKFNHKKRVSLEKSKSSSCSSNKLHSANVAVANHHPNPTFKQPQAVGSQKRKARKESITRRDISTINDEVASIIPMSKAGFNTIQGCYILNDVSVVAEQMKTIPSLCVTTTNNNNNNNTSSLCSSSSTSDLLILAEVAAKRTELSN